MRGEHCCQRIQRGLIALGRGKVSAYRLQHLAVGFVFDACGQCGGLHRSAVQNAFDSRGIGFTAQCGADLLGNSSAGAGVLQ